MFALARGGSARSTGARRVTALPRLVITTSSQWLSLSSREESRAFASKALTSIIVLLLNRRPGCYLIKDAQPQRDVLWIGPQHLVFYVGGNM